MAASEGAAHLRSAVAPFTASVAPAVDVIDASWLTLLLRPLLDQQQRAIRAPRQQLPIPPRHAQHSLVTYHKLSFKCPYVFASVASGRGGPTGGFGGSCGWPLGGCSHPGTAPACLVCGGPSTLATLQTPPAVVQDTSHTQFTTWDQLLRYGNHGLIRTTHVCRCRQRPQQIYAILETSWEPLQRAFGR